MEFKFKFSVAGRPEATGNGAEQPVPARPPASRPLPSSGKEGQAQAQAQAQLGGRSWSPSAAAELGVPGPGLREHPVPWGELDQLLDNKIVEVLELGSSPAIKIKHVNVAVVEMALSRQEGEEEEEGVSGAISTHSDLIPGVYEGGLKIWECTFDLLKYLDGVDLRSRRVLDLGCGAGLLGILALRKQAEEVHFQDYNGAVIEEITIPNVALSAAEEEESGSSLGGREEPGVEDEDDDDPPEKRRKGEESSPPPKQGMLSRCRFFSGEWSQFSKVHGSNGSFKYDVILTSETLYNPDCYGALHDTLLNLLSEKGTVYLASKIHYFGVGGGIHLYENFVKENKVFEIKTVKVIDDGLQRCIAAMSFRRVKCS